MLPGAVEMRYVPVRVVPDCSKRMRRSMPPGCPGSGSMFTQVPTRSPTRTLVFAVAVSVPSLTVRVTLKVPPLLNTWVALGPEPVPPSPKFQV